MTDTVNSRTIAAHLSTLACLLEAEAARAQALGLRPSRDLAREAREVRDLGDCLWQADVQLALSGGADRAGRSGSGNVVPIGSAAG
ncbi:MAG TPA: hypothetical protein VIM12_11375 [Noviherbaspirillum sp.]|jgi:hypothetical protein|uniref:hypothetical protein n=1 Tax=Noviherbaspirillum sp. TaxID=1926288 RepID=UPI002F92D1C3